MRTLNNYILNTHQLKATLCLDSFYYFVVDFWDVVVPEEMVTNWHIQYICDEMQIVAERVFAGQSKEYDLLINVPPGSSKSTICSIMFPAWCLARMPQSRHICGSYALDLAMELGRKSRMIVESEKYKAYFPHVKLQPDQNTKTHFATSKGGGRVSVGSGGSITGFHGHFILIDDPLSPLKAASEAELATVNNWMKETIPTRKVNKEIAPTIVIMQRLHQNDPSGEWLDRTKGAGVKHICLPESTEWPINPPEIAERYIDGLLDPVRLPRSVMEAFRNGNEYSHAGQFGQQPIPRGGGMFKTSQLQVVTGPTDKIVESVRFWDKAGTIAKAGKEPAWTVGVLLHRYRNGRFFVADVIRGRWASEERERIIKQTAERDGPDVIIGIEQEPGSGGKESAENTIKNLAGYRVKVDRPTGDKASRADPFSTQVNVGAVDILRADWNNVYLDEMSYFPNSKFKDQVDASAGAFNLMTLGKKKKAGVF